MKHCPHCNGVVQDGAIKCKHCKHFIERKNEEKVRENENIFKNPTKEDVIIKEEKVKNQEIHVPTPQKKIVQKSRNNETDLGKILAISVIGISIFILFAYILVNFAKSYNTENKANIDTINPVITEKSKETQTESKTQAINTSSKTEEKPIEKPKEEKRGEVKKILQDVNLRSDSTSSSEKIHTIYEGDEVEVLGKMTNSQGYLWYKVKHDGMEGWISYVGFEKKEEEKKSKNKSEITLDDFYNKTIYGEYYEYGPQFYIVTSKNNKDLWDCDYRVVTQYKIKTSMKEGILVPAESRTTTRKYAFTQDVPDVVDKTCTYLGTGPINAQIVGESVGF